jgi:hypothetical protein
MVGMIWNLRDIQQDRQLHFVLAIHQVSDKHIEHIFRKTRILHQRCDLVVILVQHEILNVLCGFLLAFRRKCGQ